MTVTVIVFFHNAEKPLFPQNGVCYNEDNRIKVRIYMLQTPHRKKGCYKICGEKRKEYLR